MVLRTVWQELFIGYRHSRNLFILYMYHMYINMTYSLVECIICILTWPCAQYDKTYLLVIGILETYSYCICIICILIWLIHWLYVNIIICTVLIWLIHYLYVNIIICAVNVIIENWHGLKYSMRGTCNTRRHAQDLFIGYRHARDLFMLYMYHMFGILETYSCCICIICILIWLIH